MSTTCRNFPSGPAGVRQEMAIYRAAMPDLHFTIEDVIAEHDRVVTRVVATGTQRGDLPRIKASGRRATMTGIVIFLFRVWTRGRSVDGVQLPQLVLATRCHPVLVLVYRASCPTAKIV